MTLFSATMLNINLDDGSSKSFVLDSSEIDGNLQTGCMVKVVYHKQDDKVIVTKIEVTKDPRS